MPDRKNVAVFFGGKSPEHDVSIVTAIASVIKPLRALGHNVLPIYISKNGDWFTGDDFAEIKTYQTGRASELMARSKPLRMSLNGGLTIFGNDKTTKKGWKVDIAFPAMHGSFGEDGSLMGLFRMANVPFVGCDMEASVLSMNKVVAKEVAAANGIPIVKYLSFQTAEFQSNPERVEKLVNETLSYPLFVKPPRLGSSIGISKVIEPDKLVDAMEVAAYYDRQILVEQAVPNLIEVTVPIIGLDQPIVSMVERPLKLADDFFDFESKYINGGGKKGKGGQGYSELPAQLPDGLYEKSESVALDVYKCFGLSGIARVDLLIDEKARQVYFNEINPMPGDLYAHNFAKNGISKVELIQKLLDYAEEAFAIQSASHMTFEADYLKQF